MYVQIGSPENPSDVVDLFLECHERIRTFIGLAARLAKTEDASPDEVRDAAARVARYFSDALPLHVADEEQSILPRLAGRSRELDSALDKMNREHREHEQPLRLLLEACKTLKSSPELLDRVREKLAEAVAGLDTDYAAHLQEEERIILPAIRTFLTPAQKAEIESELRARRR